MAVLIMATRSTVVGGAVRGAEGRQCSRKLNQWWIHTGCSEQEKMAMRAVRSPSHQGNKGGAVRPKRSSHQMGPAFSAHQNPRCSCGGRSVSQCSCRAGASKNAWRRMSAEVRMVKEVKIFVRSGAAFSRPSYHVTARRSLATMLSLLLEPPG